MRHLTKTCLTKKCNFYSNKECLKGKSFCKYRITKYRYYTKDGHIKPIPIVATAIINNSHEFEGFLKAETIQELENKIDKYHLKKYGIMFKSKQNETDNY